MLELRPAHIPLTLCLLSTAPGCGGRQLGGADAETTIETSTASTNGNESETGDAPTETDGPSETGEPEGCAACGPDEACVAVAVSSECLLPDVHELRCVPLDPSCETDEGICAEPCVDALCGPSHDCVTACTYVEDVDIWCAPTGLPEECDPLAQDCSEGEKCVPYAQLPGDNWNANKCVPVLGDRATGEPCMSDGSHVATDNCDATGMCWGYGEDLQGTCHAFCDAERECEEGTDCLYANGGVVAVCLPVCLPFDPDTCEAGQVCLWGGTSFNCFEAQTVEPYGVCEPDEHCPAGQTCRSAEVLDGCLGPSCCTDYCDAAEPGEPCPDPLSCVLLELADYPTIGVCRLPDP